MIAALARDGGVPVSVDTSKAGVAAGRDRRGRDRRERRLGRTRRPRHARASSADAGRRATSSCTCRASRARCSATRTTTTSSARWPASSPSGSTSRATRASTPARCASIPASASARRSTHNLTLLARLDDLVAVVACAGDGRHVAQVVHRVRARRDRRPGERDDGTLATTMWAIDHGAAVVRVHAVRPRSTRCGSGASASSRGSAA